MTRSVLGLLIAFPAATAVLAAGEEMRQGPYLVGDFDSSGIPIQKDEEDAIWIPAMAVDARSRGFFELDDGAHGLELWASDGTPEGTGLLKDIFPGPAGSNPELLTAAGGRRIGGQRDGYHLVYQGAGLELELKVRVETLDGLPGAAAGRGSRRRRARPRSSWRSVPEAAPRS